jgi:hypothetical protein
MSWGHLMLLNDVKHYCILDIERVKVEKEKAPTANRGLFGSAWSHGIEELCSTPILTLHAKVRNTFMECYG